MRFPTLLAIMLLAALPARAGFGDGAAAFSSRQYARALEAWRPVAEAGDSRAQFHLAVLLEQGLGVARDIAAARQWYARAAAQGQPEAAARLGFLATEPGDALKWFQIAARRGDPRAQYALAAMLAAGRGVGRDLARARGWLLMARSGARGGPHGDAVARSLGVVSAAMNGDQIARSEALAASWREAGDGLPPGDRAGARPSLP